MPCHRPRPQRRSRTSARYSSRRCRRGSGTGRVAPLDRLPNATRRVPTPALASTRSPTADLGRRCAERSPHPSADSASTPRNHLGRSRQTSRFILSLDTLGSSYVIHRIAWRDCLENRKWALKRRFEKLLEDTKESSPLIFCHQTRTVENPLSIFQTVSGRGVLRSSPSPGPIRQVFLCTDRGASLSGVHKAQ